MHTRGIRCPQTSTQIVRICHAIKNQQQCGPLDTVEYFVEIIGESAGIRHSNNALMSRASCQAVQTIGTNRVHRASRRSRLLNQRLHAFIAALSLYIYFPD
jgi:hypothetical protein